MPHEASRQLGTDPVGRLLVRMSAPAAVGLLVQALYNLTDTIFVGRGVGTLAIAGIVISFPVQLLVMAIAQTLGIGSASIVSRALGAGDVERAERALGTLFTLVITISVTLAVAGSIFLGPLLRLFGAPSDVMPYAGEYLRIILIGTVFFMFAMSTNAIIRAEGNAKIAMVTMLIAGGLNIVLDPLFIFGFRLGIRGAALATVISQTTTVIYLLFYFLRGRGGLRVRVRNLRIDARIALESFAVGAGSFARMVAGSLMMIVLNNVLRGTGGSVAIATLGVLNRLFTFLLLPMFGIVQGLQPIVGYNYGAGLLDRARRVVHLANATTTAISLLAFTLMMTIPEPLMRMFSEDPELIAMGVPALRVLVIAFPLIGYQVVAAGMYQALGRIVPALVLALLRQVLLLLPLVLILPRFFDLPGVWMSFPIADTTAGIVTALLLVHAFRWLRDDPNTSREPRAAEGTP
ncbi:MAG: MATE family efflux transporter [Candidatus Bipolaricaulota bacterium]|nr:MAG: MATE family efflux transporter [Candidatus Bipolaricaulota bacterium]